MNVRDDLGTLNLSDVPVAMVEIGNMRNSGDADQMTSTSGRARQADALVRGIRRHHKSPGQLKVEIGCAYLFISHDLAVVRSFANRVAVMYLGRFCEVGPVDAVFGPPYHPYTRALLSAVPTPDPDKQRNIVRLEGAIPSPRNPPSGCRFHTRCPNKIGRVCEDSEPPLQQAGDGHWIACHIPLAELAGQPPVLAPSPSRQEAAVKDRSIRHAE